MLMMTTANVRCLNSRVRITGSGAMPLASKARKKARPRKPKIRGASVCQDDHERSSRHN